MSSTFSNLKFELIGNGEQSGTWGTTTNTNIGTAIEQAVVGMATLEAADFTANVATLTLANTNAAQDARALCLNIASGAVSAAGTVNVPAIEKPYIVINGSSFTVTVKVSGQTGVAVPAGKRTVVYNNGTDVGSQINWLAALDITTLNATTVDATNVEVTNVKAKDGTAGMSIADSTGVVSFTANPTLSGGTANGVAFLNGSKVLTTGSALTFDGTNLGLVGTGNRGLSVTTNTSGNPSISLVAGGVSSGFVQYSRANIALELSADGATPFYSIDYTGIHKWLGASNAEQMRLTSTGLGIGTSSPAYKLDMTVTAANNAGMRIYNSTAGTGNGCGISFSVANGFSSTNQHAAIQALSEASGNTLTSLAFYTSGGSNSGNATERMRLDSSGNLGLGVTPSAWAGVLSSFDLNGNGSVFGGLTLATAGINVASNTYYSSGFKYKVSGQAATNYLQQAGQHQFFTAPSGTAGNAISFTQAATLTAAGVFLVGKTATGDTTVGFEVQPVGTIVVYRDGGPAGIFGRSNDGELIRFNRGGFGDVGSIDVTTTSTSYNTSSDYRLKNTIAPMTGALAKVALLKPCTYKWNADGSDGEGFIAHELAEVVPQAVTGQKDAVDAEGKPQYQGIDTSFLVATLTAAIQELKAEFEAYKATHP
jgi:hypothetical protein